MPPAATDLAISMLASVGCGLGVMMWWGSVRCARSAWATLFPIAAARGPAGTLWSGEKLLEGGAEHQPGSAT